MCESQKSEVYPGSPGAKEKIFRCHVIKVFQVNEIHVKMSSLVHCALYHIIDLAFFYE